MNRVESRYEIARPVVEHVRKSRAIGDTEREIEIGPAVPTPEGERPDLGSGHYAGIVPSKLQHVIAQAIPLFHGEHGSIMPEGWVFG
jgi:hypothetical protein